MRFRNILLIASLTILFSGCSKDKNGSNGIFTMSTGTNKFSASFKENQIYIFEKNSFRFVYDYYSGIERWVIIAQFDSKNEITLNIRDTKVKAGFYSNGGTAGSSVFINDNFYHPAAPPTTIGNFEVTLTNANYPGRISGTYRVTGQNSKVLCTGEFDFVTTQ